MGRTGRIGGTTGEGDDEDGARLVEAWLHLREAARRMRWDCAGRGHAAYNGGGRGGRRVKPAATGGGGGRWDFQPCLQVDGCDNLCE
jgi:hypothetical protein